MKLLGLLPIATGSGVFLLLSGKADLLDAGAGEVPRALGAIGVFGSLFTAGLFAYELYGIKKCHYLIESGRRLEAEVGLEGQFRSRPYAIARRINEPFASAIIYPSCLAAWVFLALVFPLGVMPAGVVALLPLMAGFLLTLYGAGQIVRHQREDDLVLAVVRQLGPIGRDGLAGKVDLPNAKVNTVVDRLVSHRALLEVGEYLKPRE